MKNKIIIDITEAGLPIVKITRPRNLEFSKSISSISYDHYSDDDVRDKLVSRFLGMGHFALITTDSGNPGDAEIHSMNALDVLQNILDVYSGLIPVGKTTIDGESFDLRKEFEQSIYKVCSLIEQWTNERSTAFEKKSAAQEIINGK